ncbi:MAG TPA: ABC transporter ATP-binding protein [Verrucomicrobiae bacterium]
MRTALKSTAEVIRILWRLRPYLRGGRHLILAVVIAAFLATMLESIGVGLLVPLLSLLLEGEGAAPMRPILVMQDWIPGKSTSFYVGGFCLLVLTAIIGKNVVLYLSQVLAARLKKRTSVNLRDALFRKLQSAPLSLFEQRTSGELTNICYNETGRANCAIDYLLLGGQRVSMALLYMAMLVYISWPLSILTVCLGFLIGLSVSSMQRKLSQRGKEVSDNNQEVLSCLHDAFSGIRVVRATNSQQRETDRFHEVNLKQAATDEKVSRYNAMMSPLGEVIAVMGAMAIVGLAYWFFVSTGKMRAPHLMAYGFILLRLLPLVNQIYGLLGTLVFLAPGVREVETWLTAPDFPQKSFGDSKFTDVKKEICFENLGFTYENGTEAIKNVSFVVPAGKTVALVGPSGSGKSTLASLLLRLRQPTQGRISVDGTDYWEFSAASWHQRVSVVEQEAFLFHDTLRANITYGHEKSTEADIKQAITDVALEDVIQELPEGLDTIVGERGMLLSGGQRQRLAIARTLVRHPTVMVLDEATSALDNIAERQVQAALERARQGRTVVVIAHRLSTIRNADHIVVMQNGQVAEQGTWEQLVARKGLFEKLVSHSGMTHLAEATA